MLLIAGISIAIDTDNEVKMATDLITKSNDEDGVTCYLEKLI